MKGEGLQVLQERMKTLEGGGVTGVLRIADIGLFSVRKCGN